MGKYSIKNGNKVKRNFSTSSHCRINLTKTANNKNFNNTKN